MQPKYRQYVFVFDLTVLLFFWNGESRCSSVLLLKTVLCNKSAIRLCAVDLSSGGQEGAVKSNCWPTGLPRAWPSTREHNGGLGVCAHTCYSDKRSQQLLEFFVFISYDTGNNSYCLNSAQNAEHGIKSCDI